MRDGSGLAQRMIDDLWYKNGVSLLSVRRHLYGRQRRRHRRFQGPAAAAGLSAGPRHHHDLADAVPALARQGRRLRHLRLLRRRSALRHARRLRRVHPWLPAARHPRDHRSRRQPHLRSARLVSAGASARRTRPTATGMSGPTRSRPMPTRAWCFPACRNRPGRATRRPAPGTSIASTISSPTSTRRTRRCRPRSSRSWASGSSSAYPASAWTRCRS